MYFFQCPFFMPWSSCRPKCHQALQKSCWDGRPENLQWSMPRNPSTGNKCYNKALKKDIQIFNGSPCTVQIGHSTDEQSRMQNKKGRGVLMMFLKHKIQVTTTRWSVKIELFTSSYEKYILSTLFFRSSYPFLTMTAEIGGYLGLILGVSLIHLVQALRGAMQFKKIEIKLVTHWNETEGKQIQHSVIFLFQVKFTIFKQFRFRDNTQMFSTD